MSFKRTHFDFVYVLGAALQNITYAQSLPDAKRIARENLKEITHFENGLDGMPDSIRHRWVAAAHKKED